MTDLEVSEMQFLKYVLVFIVGMIAGGTIGVLIMGLASAAKKGDEK